MVGVGAQVKPPQVTQHTDTDSEPLAQYTHTSTNTHRWRERGEGEVYMQYTDLSLFRDIIGQDAERECLLADSSEELQCGTCGEHVSTGIS